MKEINFEQIGKKLREIRIDKHLTQEYVAYAANVNTSHISNIENNRVKGIADNPCSYLQRA